jgi:hypothetical protein
MREVVSCCTYPRSCARGSWESVFCSCTSICSCYFSACLLSPSWSREILQRHSRKLHWKIGGCTDSTSRQKRSKNEESEDFLSLLYFLKHDSNELASSSPTARSSPVTPPPKLRAQRRGSEAALCLSKQIQSPRGGVTQGDCSNGQVRYVSYPRAFSTNPALKPF